MEVPALSQSALVGGTALSLRHGHRTSIDLDLFSSEKFENTTIEDALKNEFGEKFDYKKTHEKFYFSSCQIALL
jgi:hypothetical protein